mmetsp:Transcript_13853/g.50473  ORF Transcript_13853/g.50473 Transcript_13853/m.50473 type:complete len:115 (-) Transcript_13853:519-863(-)
MQQPPTVISSCVHHDPDRLRQFVASGEENRRQEHVSVLTQLRGGFRSELLDLSWEGHAQPRKPFRALLALVYAVERCYWYNRALLLPTGRCLQSVLSGKELDLAQDKLRRLMDD